MATLQTRVVFKVYLRHGPHGQLYRGDVSYAGIINTPLTKHVYGGGYLGAAVKTAVGIIGYPWLKSPAQGAATSITAAVSPEMEPHSGEATCASGQSCSHCRLGRLYTMS